MSCGILSSLETLRAGVKEVGTCSKPIDLTMDGADSEQDLNTTSPDMQLESSISHHPPTVISPSARQDIDIDMVLPVATDKVHTASDEDNSDLHVPVVEKSFSAESPSLISGGDTSRVDNTRVDVKMEGADDSHMMQPLFPTNVSPIQLRADHLNLIYEMDGTKMVCRLCVYVYFYRGHLSDWLTSLSVDQPRVVSNPTFFSGPYSTA